MSCAACGKSARARLYCHRSDCSTLKVDLPRPDVTVTTNEGKTHLVVSRQSSDSSPIGRSYEVVGSTESEKIKDAVEKVLNDGYSAEWLPKP